VSGGSLSPDAGVVHLLEPEPIPFAALVPAPGLAFPHEGAGYGAG